VPDPGIDPRILQANERTLLAWIRTALAVIAFGFVIARAATWLRAADPGTSDGHGSGSVWLGAGFIVLGMASNVIAVIRFARARNAILAGRPIPSGGLTGISLALGLTVLAGALLVYALAAW
jgi:putative membrane protein